MLKEFLSEIEAPYALHNLNTDPEAVATFLRLGFRLPPAVVIDGVTVEGFQPERIEDLVAKARLRDEERRP